MAVDLICRLWLAGNKIKKIALIPIIGTLGSCGDLQPPVVQELPSLCLSADLNNDGTIDGIDLDILIGNWGNSQCDLNGDAIVGIEDLEFLLNCWGG